MLGSKKDEMDKKDGLGLGKKERLSIIDKDCSFEGAVNVGGKLIIAGSLKGTIAGNAVVTVEGSRVEAKAKVRSLIIGGQFQGDIIVSESMRIVSTGVFSGSMACRNFTLDAGGKLDGRVKPLDTKEVPEPPKPG
ncbi:MAG: polymer-forming cytoskeletal protein [Deltaproteobacteria bacterium]|nr:polymer-forming cytoskeletal protein [Deltaproteobacteria bacterium]MBW2260320.1 polymer-forming cytoskeletal protein [Deltaproteobacteria bacterium]